MDCLRKSFKLYDFNNHWLICLKVSDNLYWLHISGSGKRRIAWNVFNRTNVPYKIIDTNDNIIIIKKKYNPFILSSFNHLFIKFDFLYYIKSVDMLLRHFYHYLVDLHKFFAINNLFICKKMITKWLFFFFILFFYIIVSYQTIENMNYYFFNICLLIVFNWKLITMWYR